MQFLIIGRDYTDGLKKCLSVRDEHVSKGDIRKAAGNYHMGVALLDEKGDMCGSVMVMEFSSRKELDEWLKTEPYVVSNVWKTIEIIPCKIGPSFTKA